MSLRAANRLGLRQATGAGVARGFLGAMVPEVEQSEIWNGLTCGMLHSAIAVGVVGMRYLKRSSILLPVLALVIVAASVWSHVVAAQEARAGARKKVLF